MSSSGKRNIVSCASRGEPPRKKRGKCETVKFVIYEFKREKWELDDCIMSDKLTAHGYEWDFEVCNNVRCESVDVLFFLRTKGVAATAYYTLRCKEHQTDCVTRFYHGSDGDHLYLEGPIDLYLEEDGSLKLECDVRRVEEHRRVWFPKKIEKQEMFVELYQDASSETSDVAFSVGNKTYQVHTNVLSLRCKKLYEVAKETSDDTTVPIPILSVGEKTFENMLKFIYTVETEPFFGDKETAIDHLVAADLYDCVQLKLYAESILAFNFLDDENAAALLMFADSHSCALLKESAIGVILDDPKAVKETPDWQKVEESAILLKDILDASLRRSEQLESGDRSTADGVDWPSVGYLRDELQEAKLDLDGSREVLLKRWKALQLQNNQNK